MRIHAGYYDPTTVSNGFRVNVLRTSAAICTISLTDRVVSGAVRRLIHTSRCESLPNSSIEDSREKHYHAVYCLDGE